MVKKIKLTHSNTELKIQFLGKCSENVVNALGHQRKFSMLNVLLGLGDLQNSFLLIYRGLKWSPSSPLLRPSSRFLKTRIKTHLGNLWPFCLRTYEKLTLDCSEDPPVSTAGQCRVCAAQQENLRNISNSDELRNIESFRLEKTFKA